MNAARKPSVVDCPQPDSREIEPGSVVYGAPSWSNAMTPIQRDKCYGRRLVASGGDFGITYAAPITRGSRIKQALAEFPFVALVALVIVSAMH
jgi:hypothetical protein